MVALCYKMNLQQIQVFCNIWEKIIDIFLYSTGA